jgi:hypothetical protein
LASCWRLLPKGWATCLVRERAGERAVAAPATSYDPPRYTSAD